MKLNNRGWGTTEMLFLSAGIIIALLVAVYFISKLYGSFDNSVKNKQYADLEAKLSSAAKKYVIEKNIEVGDRTLLIDLNDLISNNYLDSFSDLEGYPCSGYVTVYKADLVNTYKAFIRCKNYNTQNN